MATYSTVTVQDDCCIGISACDEVLVCLDESWAEKTVSGCTFVIGSIVTINRVVEVVKKKSCTSNIISCKPPVTGKEHCDYVVKIELDDQTLVDPETELPYTIEDSDVEGLVKNLCIYQRLIDCAELGVTTPFSVEDTITLDLTVNPTVPQTLSGNVNVSANDGNKLTIESDGLFVCGLTAVETPTIEIFVEDLACQNISAIVKISADVGNTIVENEDGIYAACCGDEGTLLLVEDTDTVDLTINPTAPQTISADVNVSLDIGNIIEVHVDGLYVATGGGEGCGPLSVTDTATLNLTISPTCDQTLSGVVKISADVGNIITEEPDGLFATGGGTPTEVEVDNVQACTETFTILVDSVPQATVELRDHSYYTQVGHGLALPAFGVLPVKWDGVQYAEAQADTVANQAILLASSFPDANTIRLVTDGFLTVTHGLTIGVWYALDPAAPGNVVEASTLDPLVDVYELLFFTQSEDCILIRIRPCECAPDLPVPPEPEVIVQEDFNDGGTCGRLAFWTSGIDASQYSPNTAETPYVSSPVHSGTCAGHYYLQEGTDELVPFTLYKEMPFSEIYMEWWLYFASNPGPLPFPWAAQKLARLGSIDGPPPGSDVPFIYMTSPSGFENGNYQVLITDDLGNQIYLNDEEEFFTDDTWGKLALYAKLNTPGTADGIFKYYFNDALIDGVTNLVYRQLGNTDEWSFFFILGNNSWGNGAGAPTYPGAPHFSVPEPGGHMYIDDVLVLTTKPGALS